MGEREGEGVRGGGGKFAAVEEDGGEAEHGEVGSEGKIFEAQQMTI